MLNLLLMSEEQVEDLLKSLEILWKGLLAMVVVIGVIIAVTYVMQGISKKVANAKKQAAESAEKNASIESDN